MSEISVVFHSGYGHTTRQAEALCKGANGTLLVIDPVGELLQSQWDTLHAADAIVFGSPTYMGSVRWQFKKFADATSKAWYSQQWKDKIFGGFTNSASMNGDKLSTLHYFFTLAMQHGGVWVGPALMPSNTKAASRDDLNYLSSYAGAMMQTPSDATVDELSQGDLETARRYGERIAKLTKQLRG